MLTFNLVSCCCQALKISAIDHDNDSERAVSCLLPIALNLQDGRHTRRSRYALCCGLEYYRRRQPRDKSC